MTKAGTAGEMDTIAWQFPGVFALHRTSVLGLAAGRIDAYLRHEDRSDVPQQRCRLQCFDRPRDG